MACTAFLGAAIVRVNGACKQQYTAITNARDTQSVSTHIVVKLIATDCAPFIGVDRYNADMLYALKLHPESNCPPVTRFDTRLTRQGSSGASSVGSRIELEFVIHGNIGSLALPVIASPDRVDELWQHTCCEAFVGSADCDAYYEFNFSPSTQWAAYRFNNYRAGMEVANEIGTPQVTVESTIDRFELRATIDLPQLVSLSSAQKWRFGLSAVIEENSGRKSYWALAHPAGRPDFHHVAGFTIELER